MRTTKKQHGYFIVAMFLHRIDLIAVGHTDFYSTAGLPEKSRES